MRQAFGVPCARPATGPAAPRAARAGPAAGSGTGVRLVSRGRSSRPTWCSACAGLSRTDEQQVRARRAERGAGRRHVVAAVPGDPGEARAGLLGLQLHLPARRRRLWGIYAGCLPAKADEVLAICQEEIAKVIAGGLTDDELDRGKGQLRGVARARPGGPVVADEPARQVGAGLLAARTGRGDPRRPSTAVTLDDVRRGRRRRPGPAQGRSPWSARSTTTPRSPRPLAYTAP